MRGSRTLALPFVMQGPRFRRLLNEARPYEFRFSLRVYSAFTRARPEKRQGGCQEGQDPPAKRKQISLTCSPGTTPYSGRMEPVSMKRWCQESAAVSRVGVCRP